MWLLLSPFHFKSYDTYDIERHTNKTLSLRGHRSYLSLISRGQWMADYCLQVVSFPQWLLPNSNIAHWNVSSNDSFAPRLQSQRKQVPIASLLSPRMQSSFWPLLSETSAIWSLLLSFPDGNFHFSTAGLIKSSEIWKDFYANSNVNILNKWWTFNMFNYCK